MNPNVSEYRGFAALHSPSCTPCDIGSMNQVVLTDFIYERFFLTRGSNYSHYSP